jgi:hypothetical protein
MRRMHGGEMRYNELVETQEQISDESNTEQLLEQYFDLSEGTYTIHLDNSVTVDGNCRVQEKIIMEKLPVKFRRINGDFGCVKNGLESLVGFPTWITGNFYCGGNNLTSLVGGPIFVTGSYNCVQNKLTSLVGVATHIGNWLLCSENPFVSLEGFPKELKGIFYCTWSPSIPLLRTLQAKKGVRIEISERSGEHPTTHIINTCKKNNPGNLRAAILDAQKALIDAGYAGNAKW